MNPKYVSMGYKITNHNAWDNKIMQFDVEIKSWEMLNGMSQL